MAYLVLALLVMLVAGVDLLAAVILGAGLAAVLVAARRQRRGSLVSSVVAALLVTTIVGTMVAVAVDVDRSRPDPLVVRTGDDPISAGSRPPTELVRQLLTPPVGTLTTLGFAATDYDDTAAGVDRAVPSLSLVAATGVTLGADPGTIRSRSTADPRVRAHMGGAGALLTVSNENSVDFDPKLAMAVLEHPRATARLISALTSEVARGGWDGLVVDFEQLPSTARTLYPAFLGAVRQALGGRPLLASVPVFTANDPDARAYDLSAIAANVDRIVLMTYDQHDPTGSAGPIGGVPWLTDVVDRARAVVPAPQLMLGLAGYGYRWYRPGQADEVSFADFQKLRGDPANRTQWDPVQGEWTVRAPDGSTTWFQDSRSAQVRAQIALHDGLSGVALWRLGSEDPATWTVLPSNPGRLAPARPNGRPVRDTNAAGLVALTFDDGPDPTWTPKILDILRREHVPATFFAIGERAQQFPDLVRREVGAGDVVGNHTYSHPDLAKSSTWRAKLEILAGADVIEGVTGRKPLLFRSPYGEGDGVSANATPPDQMAEDMGFTPVRWNDDPEDWSRPGVDKIVRRAVAQASERTVILLHDSGGNRAETVAALPRIIETLRARGFLFTTVDALDGSVRNPYIQRTTWGDRARGVVIVASFRLVRSLGQVIQWSLVLIVVLSVFRLLVGLPLALSHWRRSRRAAGPAPSADGWRPTVTALVPAHDEATVIGKTLTSLELVDWPGLEVIVIDDGSVDDTASIARSHGVRVIRQSQSGKAAALNAGIAEAAGEVVVVIDADTVLDASFLDHVVPHFVDGAVVAVAGNVKVGNRSKLLSRLQALEYVVSLNLDRRAQARINSISVVPGAAGTFRRSSLLEVGGYPTETLVEDTDLTVALLGAGGVIEYEPRAVAWTEAPETVRDVLKQRRRWSFGTLQVAAKRGDLLFRRDSGRVGAVGLPWMLVSQILLPVAGPLVDLYLLWLVLQGSWAQAAVMASLSIVADLVVAVGAIAMDGERWSLLWSTPGLRLIWRPLQLGAVCRSAYLWLIGSRQSWRRVDRYGTVIADVQRLEAVR